MTKYMLFFAFKYKYVSLGNNVCKKHTWFYIHLHGSMYAEVCLCSCGIQFFSNRFSLLLHPNFWAYEIKNRFSLFFSS